MSFPSVPPVISIIIPVLHDTAALARCLVALRTQSVRCEIIVCDGGNDAACAELARTDGAHYVSSEPGRAVQMNAGAARAIGQWLWFLHADCTPPRGALEALANVDRRRAWGCFRHRLAAPGILLRVIERADNLRAAVFALPYGDQGLFVRRDVFEKIGAFARVPLLEDVMLARTLAEFGMPRVLPPVLSTDARRWLRHGVWKTTFVNWRVLWLYFVMGRDLAEIAAYYRGISPGSGPSERSTSSVRGATEESTSSR